MSQPKMPRLATGPSVTDDKPTDQIDACYRVFCVICNDRYQAKDFSPDLSKQNFARFHLKNSGWVWRKQHLGWWCAACMQREREKKR